MTTYIPDITPELSFKTSRSGGAGGQNVNKVETAVTASWQIASSALFSEEQINILLQKLAHRMDKDGILSVRSQVHRTQLANKEEAIKRLQEILAKALEPKRPRIATKPSKQSKEKRLDLKKRASVKKQNRKKTGWED